MDDTYELFCVDCCQLDINQHDLTSYDEAKALSDGHMVAHSAEGLLLMLVDIINSQNLQDAGRYDQILFHNQTRISL